MIVKEDRMLKRRIIECDLAVVGGGIAGMCAAIAAARRGTRVVLMHERAVLGGNASSEIRMWICGAAGKNNRETGIVEEIALENMYRNPTKNYAIWDTVLYDMVKREANIELLLNCTCMDAVTERGSYSDGREIRITSITGYQMTTQSFIEVRAHYYADCSGDSILAPLTDARFRMGREGRDEFGENTQVEKSDDMTMGMSCIIFGREGTQSVKYTPPAFATKLTDADFERKNIHFQPNALYREVENFWYLELGGDRHSIDDTEEVRDDLLALATGTWDYVKNSGRIDADKWDLDFLGFLPGKRESRRMVGEYTVTERDISGGRVFEDEVAYGGWPLDDHFPGGFWHVGTANTYYETPAPYSLPYRALYSLNVENLFFAGRNISMTHTAMSSIRVMATCGLLGEAVGCAAAIATKYGLTPHGVYLNKIKELQRELGDGDCFLPSFGREISEICKSATLSVDAPVLRNGEDRAHRLYGTEDGGAEYAAELGCEIRYSFDPAKISYVHLTFSSDLNRDTLPGGGVERTHSTRANIPLDAPQTCMPKTLCRSFTLYGELRGERTVLLEVEDNRRRAYHIEIGRTLDALVLVPHKSWGDGNTVPVISFDFG